MFRISHFLRELSHSAPVVPRRNPPGPVVIVVRRVPSAVVKDDEGEAALVGADRLWPPAWSALAGSVSLGLTVPAILAASYPTQRPGGALRIEEGALPVFRQAAFGIAEPFPGFLAHPAQFRVYPPAWAFLFPAERHQGKGGGGAFEQGHDVLSGSVANAVAAFGVQGFLLLMA